MISGEPVPVEKRLGDAVTGGTINKKVPVYRGRRPHRRRDASGADRSHGERRPAKPRSIQKLVEQNLGDLCAGRHRRFASDVPRLVCLRPRTSPFSPRRGERGRGSYHRVPMRPRPRDAHVNHGRDRPRRNNRHPCPKRRGARPTRNSTRSSSTRPGRSPKAIPRWSPSRPSGRPIEARFFGTRPPLKRRANTPSPPQ